MAVQSRSAQQSAWSRHKARLNQVSSLPPIITTLPYKYDLKSSKLKKKKLDLPALPAKKGTGITCQWAGK